MGQALYRIYRPKSLAEVVGQEHITQTLAHALKSGRLSHAYLFTGPRGVGKTSIARILAHEINKLAYNGEPHLDIIEIDAASNRRIDDIRDLRDKVRLAPASAPYKVYIIDEVHMLTGESFNALLKTLEEPPAHVIFILATTEAHKLPATIMSRTQRFVFRPVPTTIAADYLKQIAKKEKRVIDDDALQLIAEHGEGSLRDSTSLLDQLTATDAPVTVEMVEQLLGLAPRETMRQLVAAITAHDQSAILSQLETLAEWGTGTTDLLRQLLRALRETAQSKPHPALFGLIDRLLEVPRASDPWLKLMTTLLVSDGNQPEAEAEPAPTPRTVPAVASDEPILDVSLPTISARSKPKTEPIVQKSETTTADSPAEPASHLNELNDNQWQAVLAAIKTKSRALYALLRQIQPEFDEHTQILTLRPAFQLHRRKLETDSSQQLLTQALRDVLASAPRIPIGLLQDRPAKPSAKGDSTTAAIMDMMGGGEIVEVGE